MMWEEAQIVVERRNQDAASNTALLHSAAAGVLSKQGLSALKKVLKELQDG